MPKWGYFVQNLWPKMCENVEKRERERERLKTLPYTLNFQKNHRCFAGECIDPREPEGSVSNFYERRFKHWESAGRRYRIVDFRDWLISRSTIKHVQLYRMVPSNLRSYNRQNLYAPSIDDILAFATYINVDDMDKLLQRNFDMHITNTPGNQPSRSILPI